MTHHLYTVLNVFAQAKIRKKNSNYLNESGKSTLWTNSHKQVSYHCSFFNTFPPHTNYMNFEHRNQVKSLANELIILMREYEDAMLSETKVETTDLLLDKIMETYEQIETLKQAAYN